MNTRIAALAAFLLLSIPAISGEPIKEMSMMTDVGEVVLTLEPCSFTPNHGFPYAAYATEKGSHDHLGCWHEPEQLEGKPQNQIVNTWWPELSAIASYNKKAIQAENEAMRLELCKSCGEPYDVDDLESGICWNCAKRPEPETTRDEIYEMIDKTGDCV